MPIRFIPTGQLDITTDSTMLPEQAVGEKLVASDALTRCTNLRLGHKGMARNRWGSSKINATAIDTDINLVIEHEGNRYTFAGGTIYKNEVAIATGLTEAEWSAIIYNQYNSEKQSIFAINGTDRKRITDDVVWEWGLDSPVSAPKVNPFTVCTHEWEIDYITGCALWGIKSGDYQTSNNWEAAYIDEGAISAITAPVATLQPTSLGLCSNGAHLIAVSFVTDNGETALGTNSNEVTVDSLNSKIDLTDIPIGGADIVARKLYMTKADNADAQSASATFGANYGAGDSYIVLNNLAAPLNRNDIVSVNHSGGITRYAIIFVSSWAGNTQTIAISPVLVEAVASGSVLTVIYTAPVFYLIGIIDNNVDTTYTVNKSDDDLLISNRVIQYQFYDESDVISLFADTDVYKIKYTYVRKEGDSVVFESSPSDAGSYTFVATAATKPMIVYYDKAGDTQITHVRIYRTLDGAGVYYYDSEIELNRGQAVISKTDAQLGSAVETDHDRPPLGSIVLGPNYGGVSFILKDNLVYFSATGRPEYWPTDYYVEASTKDYPLIAGTFLDTQLYVGSKNDIYLITMGTAAISSKNMGAITGTQSRQVFMGVKGHGLFHLGIDGIYQLTGNQYQPLYQGEGSDNNITNLNLRQIFEGETVGTIIGMNQDAIANCFLVVFKSKVFFAYPGIGSTYCDNMLVFGLIHKKVVHYTYPVAFRTAAVDYMNQRLLAADESGYIWHIEDMDLTTDEGAAIPWYLQSKDFTLFKKMFPRTARYDVEVGTSATGYILLNGVNKQTHTLTGDRRNRRRLIEGCNGDRLSIRLEGTGEVKIHKIEIE
jgi:hypothetical protein